MTSCQRLQGDRPSATPSPAPRHCSEPMETFTALVLFPDRPLTKVRVIPLVKEELGSDSLDDNVPGIHGAGAAHQCGQNGVGGKHIPLGFCQLQKGHKRGVRTPSGLTAIHTEGRGLLSKKPSEPHPHVTRAPLAEQGCSHQPVGFWWQSPSRARRVCSSKSTWPCSRKALLGAFCHPHPSGMC